MRIYDAATRQESNTVEEYKTSVDVGKVRLGSSHLFFRSGRKVYSVAYQEITRCFRRVLLVPMRVCCGRGELQVENLVIWNDQGEIAQIQLPDTRVAKKLMEELREKVPDAEFTCPPRAEDTNH